VQYPSRQRLTAIFCNCKALAQSFAQFPVVIEQFAEPFTNFPHNFAFFA
jgi:hypothetical protein